MGAAVSQTPRFTECFEKPLALCVLHISVDLMQEHLERIDPGSHLGLDEQSIIGYWLSETFQTIRKSLK